MVKTNLIDEEKKRILEALNNNTDAGSPLYLERYFKGGSLTAKTTESVVQILIAGLISVRGSSSTFTVNCYLMEKPHACYGFKRG